MLKNIVTGICLIVFGAVMIAAGVKGSAPRYSRFSSDRFRRIATVILGAAVIALGILAIRLAKELK